MRTELDFFVRFLDAAAALENFITENMGADNACNICGKLFCRPQELAIRLNEKSIPLNNPNMSKRFFIVFFHLYKSTKTSLIDEKNLMYTLDVFLMQRRMFLSYST